MAVRRRPRRAAPPRRGPFYVYALLDAPFVAHGNVATAGGCLSSQYLAAWMIARLASVKDAEDAIHYVAPVGEKDQYVRRAMAVIAPYLAAANDTAA